MSEKPNISPPFAPSSTSEIPIEIVSEDEMALIEAALSAAARSSAAATSLLASSSSTPVRCFRYRRAFSACTDRRTAPDMEDSGGHARKKMKAPEPLVKRFRSRKGLSVTDITATEWCEKQMEFMLFHGKPKKTIAMKAGSTRHAELEAEVIKKVKVRIKSVEDSWAVKFMNFVVGANQLIFEGLTREIPVIALVEGVWMIGVIDEIRMPMAGAVKNPSLVDTKTRVRSTLPSEAQKRNARLQLMCYKYLWDDIVVNNFPSTDFFDYFGLDAQYILSEDVRDCLASSGFHSETLGELVTYFRNTCRLLPPANEQLILRYEFQGDRSLLGEDEFTYDYNWMKNKLQGCLKFWKGEREANYVPDEEQWKCRFCSFASMCPMTKKMQEVETEEPKSPSPKIGS